MVLKWQQPEGEKSNVSFRIVALFSKGTNGTGTTRPVLDQSRNEDVRRAGWWIGVRCCWQFGAPPAATNGKICLPKYLDTERTASR
jgi:hypothetical protein